MSSDEEKATAVARLVRKMSAPGYVIEQREPAACKGCGKTEELREGYCFGCLEPYLPSVKEDSDA